MDTSCDILIIGSGIAGLRLALELASCGSVFILTKDQLVSSNTRWAQGGIAAAWEEEDSWKSHVNDTLIAGAGLCRREVVEFVAQKGKSSIEQLIDLGVRFDKKEGDSKKYSLHREGGHSTHRILHTKDLTGAEIMRALIERVRQEPNITILENWVAIDLITKGWLARRNNLLPPAPDRVLGAYALNKKSGEIHPYSAKCVAMCTGGAGKVYLYTSNPDVATGDGIAMGWRSGAAIANMEFVQFHPTCLYHPQARNFLISEALRGDGGILRNASGERFMKRYDERLELAPRDIVARSIDAELKKRGEDCVFLDMHHMSRDELQHRYPNIFQGTLNLGLDISKELIPVVPAAHYFCGGVLTDLNAESSVKNLFVIGESACTGLHGANRLASNSLLEAAVFAVSAAEKIKERIKDTSQPYELPAWDDRSATDADELVVIKQVWEEIRRFMWNYVGIVRTNRRLERARTRLALVREEIREHYWDFKLTGDLIELRNLALVAELVVESALRRRESRGLHFTSNYPESDPRFIRETLLKRYL
ncbi:MAG: L-aspartate oxidase [Proteobacteria bacterium]|nr:L-aspartate oxidase [Pseudomonadota bacterium]